MKAAQYLREASASALRSPLLRWGLIGVSVVAFVVVPFVASGYVIRFATNLFMLVAMAQAWNLLGGFGGYVSFGHVAFFGIGAYATGLAMLQGWPFVPAALFGGLAAAGVAGIIGLPILRLRGHYFAVATFAFAEVMRQLANTLTDLTGGGMGMTLPIMRGGIDFIQSFFYFAMGSLMLIVSGVAVLISRGSIGYALRAIREDEDAAEAMGVNARNYKVATLILSAFFVGVVGSVYAYWTTFLEPLALFDVENSIELVVVTLLGGVGTVAGPFLGAVVLQFASETVWIYFLNLHLLFLGAILVLVVIFIPNGIMDLLSQGKFSRASFLENIRKYRA